MLLELRILWWYAYCLSQKNLKAKGSVIAARVAEDIPCPEYFDLRDIPDRYIQLRYEIEDLDQKYQSLKNQERNP